MPNTSHNILQWNCRGLKSNYNDLLLLLSKYSPKVLCLQETLLSDNDTITLKDYTLYNTICNDNARASGGSTIAVANCVPQRQIELKTNLQAVAVEVTLHRPLSICSLYLPPNLTLSVDDLDNIANQLPQPYLLLGDFNAHNPMWGSTSINNKGNVTEKFIDNLQLCLLNDKSSTYLHPATGSFSCIDLSLAHPSIYLDFAWSVLDEQYGSDHFPLLLTSNDSVPVEDRFYFKFKKADWEQFQQLCSEDLTESEFLDTPYQADRFASILHTIASETIPKSRINSTSKIKKPWFDDECKKAVRERKASLRKFDTCPTSENLNHYRIFRAKARRTIRESKRKSWRSYVSKINSNTSIKKVWDAIRKISGKHKKQPTFHLNRNSGDTAKTPKDIADTLADTFANNSSSSHYSKEFQDHKSKIEKHNINFKSKNEEEYNSLFTIDDLIDSIKNAKDTAAGPDEIYYQFLKHLPPVSLDLLLKIFNDIWISGEVPTCWKEALVIPIPKPGKDNTEPLNYRPISLTSCICKTFERMVNKRLVWYLESQGIITNFQSGFRKQRSTNDHLVRLENFIREAFINKEHLVSIFFDLEKAYDTTWKYGILKDLKEAGLNGRLPIFISSFLSDRNFQVRVGSTLSENHQQEQGVPQGSILSVTLFGLKINNITKVLNPGVDCSLYVDDFLICYRSKNMRTIERQLQQNLDKIHTWATENGFKFSKSKTQCVHFCRLRKQHNDPELYISGSKIPVVDEAKFLGVTFDKKLSFIPHIKKLKTKCLQALNLLKVLSSTDWGSDSSTLLKLYRSLIRSKLDYGSIVYGSARKSYLQMLDTIHHQGLRLALGAFRTSPVESLYAEAGEPSLTLRRKKLSLQYATRISANSKNPARKVIFKPNYGAKFQQKPKEIKPIGLRLKDDLDTLHVNPRFILQNIEEEIPPWTYRSANVNISLSKLKKSSNPPEIFKEEFSKIKEEHMDFIHLYTDGSKDDNKVGCAVFGNNYSSKLRLPENASIFTAETKAIDLALSYISEHKKDKFIIFSDSLSVLLAIQNRKSDNVMIKKLLLRLHDILEFKTITFCWIPSHIGIRGNEKVDLLAKEALSNPPVDIQIPHSDFRQSINKLIRRKWKTVWNEAIFNKLHEINPNLDVSPSLSLSIRRDQVVISRCRIGHTRITHSYLLNREDAPTCIPCHEHFSVKHFLLECHDLTHIRDKYYRASTLKELFTTVPSSAIIPYLKESGLYFKI